jgi:hypothetical protein
MIRKLSLWFEIAAFVVAVVFVLALALGAF